MTAESVLLRDADLADLDAIMALETADRKSVV